MSEPILYPWQKRWVQDSSRLKIAVKSTQVGFSFAQGYECVVDCLEQAGNLWIILSRSERQALEFARKCKDHCRAIGVVAKLTENLAFEQTEIKQHVIEFPNNSRIIAVTSNPDTARGYTGNIVLDEFAFHKDGKAVYQAAYGRATLGFKLRVISTPAGEQGKYYELAKLCDLVNQRPPQKSDPTWSGHYCDIFLAAQEGLKKVSGEPIGLEELREGSNDEDTWQQEYCCAFISEESAAIPWNQIIEAIHGDATRELVPGRAYGSLYFGMDVGRRRDLTVMGLGEDVGDVLWVRALERLRRAPFSEQKAKAESWVRSALRGCVDATGIGMQMAEELQEKFGAHRVEAITFNLQNKEAMVIELQRRFSEHRIRIPDDPELHRAIHAVRKYPTATGHFRWDAERTEQGHADEFWFLALLAQAASGPNLSVELMSAGLRTAAAEVSQSWAGGQRGSAALAARDY